MEIPQKLTILIVDDEELLVDSIAFDFKRKKFEILKAFSGNEAFDVVDKNAVDLVISDLNMPDGNGVELLKKLKDVRPSLPFFLFIGNGTVALTAEEAYALGADAVFSKPFDRKELFEAAVRAMTPIAERFKRASARLDLEVPLGVKFLTSGFVEQSKTLNFGTGGMFLLLNDKIPHEKELVEFHVDASGIKVQGRGIVRWVRVQGGEDAPKGCGIEFIDLDEASAQKISELVKNLKHKSFIPEK